MRRRKEAGPVSRTGRRVGAAVVVAMLATLALAAPAPAFLKQDLLRFADCPYTTPGVVECVYSTTTSGEFVIGKGTVPISQTVTIQAGLKPPVLVPATDGNTLSKTALTVPGGLVGIELLGNFTEVTATAELAGTAELTSEVVLPLKVKLDNPLLGSGCYIGGEAEPLMLHLTYGTTNPPPPNKPISGHETFTTKDTGDIRVITGTLVDNAFGAPGATGCTLLPLVGDLAVNTKEGLPAAAGTNTAIMSGVTEEANAQVVKAILPLPALGRCQKLEPVAEGKRLVYHGAYTSSSCTIEAPEQTGKYEWAPGPGPKPKFTGATKTVVLETAGLKGVTCLASSSSGQYTGPKTETVAYTFTGCQIGPKGKGVPCQSSGAAAGEIRTGTLEGGLDFIKENETPTTPEVGVDLKPASGSFVTFACGSGSSSVSGSVIAPITALDKMSTTLKVKASASAGKQTPEAFEAGLKDTLTLEPSGGSSEPAGLQASETRISEEPLEVKAIA